MRKSIIIILLMVNLNSCDSNNVGEPIFWSEYFVFVTTDGDDFFMSYQDYSIDNIEYGYDERQYSFYRIDTVDNIIRFGLKNHIQREETYIFYGNGDIDTLTFDWEPKDVLIQNVFLDDNLLAFSSVDKVRFLFNGVVVTEWDFIANPELKSLIPNAAAVGLRDNPEFNPYVISLPKEPDWDELD